jgi:hypothetical protein
VIVMLFERRNASESSILGPKLEGSTTRQRSIIQQGTMLYFCTDATRRLEGNELNWINASK